MTGAKKMKMTRKTVRNLYRILLLILLLSVGMTVPAQAKTKSVTLTVGQKKKLSVKKKWKKVRWKSSKPGVVSVSAKGKITAKKPGKATITARSGKKKQKYRVTVKKSEIEIVAGGKTFQAELENNKTARAFLKLLPSTILMEELNGNEKYYYMDQTLPANAKKPGTIKAGDLMLYGDDCLVLFYETFRSSYSYTKIGHIKNVKGLKDALGRGDIKVSFIQ